jgi:hypothetical protein
MGDIGGRGRGVEVEVDVGGCSGVEWSGIGWKVIFIDHDDDSNSTGGCIGGKKREEKRMGSDRAGKERKRKERKRKAG